MKKTITTTHHLEISEEEHTAALRQFFDRQGQPLPVGRLFYREYPMSIHYPSARYAAITITSTEECG